MLTEFHPGRVGDRKLAANPFCEEVGYLSMAKYGFRVARLRALPKCVLFALSA
jgi:hypothetical protein